MPFKGSQTKKLDVLLLIHWTRPIFALTLQKLEMHQLFTSKLLYGTTYTKANELCPKTCLQYMISFSNKEWDYYDYTTLSMEFPKFVRVSRSTYSYTLLELIAEVGGYVGLFLGVSINQVTLLVDFSLRWMSK